ncbi:MAG TPA: Uma2 family endonuclease [Gemmatimonadales bacterium]
MPPATLQTAQDLLHFRKPGLPGRARTRHRAGPDLAFVHRDRLAQIPEEGYAELAPDLVAEILSPKDRPGEVLEKVGQWLSAGVRLGWVLDPALQHARVYRADGTVSIVGSDEELDGEQVLPGFPCPCGEIL